MTTSDLYIPNVGTPIDRSRAKVILFAFFVLWIFSWTLLHPTVLPSPLDVVREFPDLWSQEGLGQELITSFIVNLEALFLSIIISLPLAYLSRVPLVFPLAYAVSKLRFLSPAVFFLLLLFATSSGHAVKVWMLTLGETFFLVTALIGIVQNIPPARFEDARTLRLNEWQTTWYVVVRGTKAATYEAIRDNAAMGWSMLTMVEGFVRSEGGIGVLILNQERHMNFSVVYAVAFVVVVTGILQDEAIRWIRNTDCPYADPV